MKKIITRGIFYFVTWIILRYIFVIVLNEDLIFSQILIRAFISTILYSIIMVVFFDKDNNY